MVEHVGACHCGSVRFAFDSAAPMLVRECQCSFCRKHGSRNVSDPDGSARIVADKPLLRYRFGLGITDFLMCSECGCYVAAAMRDGGSWRATFNLNCFDDPHVDLAAEPVVYDAEDTGDRIARRLLKWTPTQIEAPEPGAEPRT